MKEMHPIATSLTISMKDLKIPKGQSEDVNWRTETTMD